MPGKWGGARRARPPLDPPMYCEWRQLHMRDYPHSQLILRVSQRWALFILADMPPKITYS